MDFVGHVGHESRLQPRGFQRRVARLLGFLDQEAEALFAFAQFLGGPSRVVVQLAQMALAQPRVNSARRLDRFAPQPVKRQHRRDPSFVAFQHRSDLLRQQAAHRARRREQRIDVCALTLRLVELAADYAFDETLVERERALGIAFGQMLEKAAEERNRHPAQRLTHPRKLVGRRVEVYRLGRNALLPARDSEGGGRATSAIRSHSRLLKNGCSTSSTGHPHIANRSSTGYHRANQLRVKIRISSQRDQRELH